MNSNGVLSILIYDTDAANPYGRELAALLSSTAPVTVVLPANTEWTPNAITVRRSLPSSAPSFILSQIFRQLSSLLSVAWSALIFGTPVVVVMTRDWYDQLLLAFIAKVGGNVAVIAHDPLPKRPLSYLRRTCQRILWKNATALVAHSEELAGQASLVSGRAVFTVPHLPFVEYAKWATSIAPNVPTQKCRLLVLGQLRADKGLDRIPHILRLVPEEQRRKSSIAFAGRGECYDIADKVEELIEVSSRPSTCRLSDLEIAVHLANSDILLAPYPLVSASGTVVLALCRGLSVVAYDTGALAEVVSSDGLVLPGDESNFAKRIAQACSDNCGGPAISIEAWRERSLAAWLSALLAMMCRH